METLRLGSTGPLVELLQSALKRAGLYNGNIDGIFGGQTQNAVITFQRTSGLIADGVVGSGTWNALLPYINGYDWYIVKSGDTLFRLASLFSVSINSIITANPGVDIYNLRIGQKIIIPIGAVVFTDISYTYSVLEMNISALQTIYPFLQTGYIGNSAMCKKIPVIRIGAGKKEVFYNAAIHANEWITAPLLMKFIENFSEAYVSGQDIFGYSARDIFENVSIYIAPMLNPDGVDLVTGAIKPGTAEYAFAEKIAQNYPSIPFPRGWKANISGIDLNLQFPANWEIAKAIKFSQGFTSPAPRDYVGPAPLIAPEAVSVYKFTLKHDFRLILAYHTQGRIIYWKYLDYLPVDSYYIGRQFAAASGYALEETPYGSSFAGYKDWFIQEYNRPGYTVEAGLGMNPLPISQFDTIYKENEGILTLGAVLAPTP